MAQEQKYIPSVTTAEIADWEKRFKESVSPMTQFNSEDKQPSMKLYSGISGIEAEWSGTIPLKAENYVKWTFSIQNEPFVEAKFNLNADSKKVIDGLYDFYNVWREEWSKSLSIPPSAEKIDKTSSELPAQGPPAVPGTAASAPVSVGSVAETYTYKNGVDRNKEKIIEDYSNRMKKLAGIK